jgi:endo-1,4-beta-xylanase
MHLDNRKKIFFASIFALSVSVLFAQVEEKVRLKELGKRHNLLIGAATDLNHNDLEEEKLISKEFSILSNENCLKPNIIQPSKGVFDFKQSDYFVTFCKKKNNIVIKGHKLIARDAYLPKWMVDSTLSPKELEAILVNHIKTLMTRYKKGSKYGEVKYWDVLNEVISDTGVYECIFKKIGKNSDGDYLYWEIAFRTARAIDPTCVLIWNEDNTEFDLPKAEKLLQTIKRLKAKGVPIDGVGFQCHIGLVGQPLPDFEKLKAMFQKFADAGLYIVITELDVTDKVNQDEMYKNMMQLCLNQPKCISWSTWNVVDKYSWRRVFLNNEAKAPLLFDDNYQPKSTYNAIQEILKLPNKISFQRISPHK